MGAHETQSGGITAYNFVGSVVKRAVAGNIIDDPMKASLKVEGGNVLVVELTKDGKSENVASVPLTEAFTKAVDETYQRIKQLEKEHDKLLADAKRWFKRSITVTLAVLGLILLLIVTLLAFLGLGFFQETIHYLPVGIAFLIVGMIAMKLYFRQSKLMREQVEQCSTNLLMAQEEYKTLQIVLNLDLSDKHRVLLEGLLISKIIGAVA